MESFVAVCAVAVAEDTIFQVNAADRKSAGTPLTINIRLGDRD